MFFSLFRYICFCNICYINNSRKSLLEISSDLFWRMSKMFYNCINKDDNINYIFLYLCATQTQSIMWTRNKTNFKNVLSSFRPRIAGLRREMANERSLIKILNILKWKQVLTSWNSMAMPCSILTMYLKTGTLSVQ